MYGLMKKEDESLRLYTDRDVSKLMDSHKTLHKARYAHMHELCIGFPFFSYFVLLRMC
jgi:hypothetical protein